MKSLNNILITALLLLGIIVFTDLDRIIFGVLLFTLFFLLGLFLGAFSVVLPLSRKPGTYLHYTDKRLRYGTFFQPPADLRDVSGNKIEPGNIIMMLPDGNLQVIHSGNHLNKSKD